MPTAGHTNNPNDRCLPFESQFNADGLCISDGLCVQKLLLWTRSAALGSSLIDIAPPARHTSRSCFREPCGLELIERASGFVADLESFALPWILNIRPCSSAVSSGYQDTVCDFTLRSRSCQHLLNWQGLLIVLGVDHE